MRSFAKLYVQNAAGEIMLEDIKTLGRESLVYGLSTVAGRMLTFLLLPFYTHYLLPADYGVSAAIFSYIAFFSILCQYGLDQAYMRHYEHREKAFPAAFYGVAVVSFVIAALLCASGERLAVFSGIGAGHGRLIRYGALILFIDALSAVPFADLRMAHKAPRYALVRLSALAVNLLLNLWLIAGAGWGIEGIFAANAVSSLFSLAVVIWPAVPRLKFTADRDLFSKMLSFALPLVPAGLGSMAVQVIDRPILLALAGPAAVGIYQANYRLGIFMMLVVSMFDQAWRPFFIERAKKPEAKPLFAKILTCFAMCSAGLVLAVSFFIEDIVKIRVAGTPLIHPAYWSGLGLVPVVLWGYLFNGLYVNFLAPAVIARKTGLIMSVTLCGAAVNIAANFALIPAFGMLGAAWATFASYFCMAALMLFAGRRHYAVPYEYGRLAAILCSAGLCACVFFLKPLIVCAGPLWLAVRLVALGAYLILAVRLLSDAEKSALMNIFQRKIPPAR